MICRVILLQEVQVAYGVVIKTSALFDQLSFMYCMYNVTKTDKSKVLNVASILPNCLINYCIFGTMCLLANIEENMCTVD